MKHEMKNPITGEFEMMTQREWWLIKLGLPRNSEVDNCTLSLLKGPSFAVGSAFDCYEIDRPGGNAWLVAQYEMWFPRLPNTNTFRQWIVFMQDHYDLPRKLDIMEELYKIQLKITTTSISSIELKIKYIEKKSALEMRQYRKRR